MHEGADPRCRPWLGTTSYEVGGTLTKSPLCTKNWGEAPPSLARGSWLSGETACARDLRPGCSSRPRSSASLWDAHVHEVRAGGGQVFLIFSVKMSQATQLI